MFFLIVESRGDTWIFRKGAVPKVSMAEAIQICEKVAKIMKFGSFTPVEASLAGYKDQNSGVWNFVHYSKNGKKYQYLVNFPQKLCLVLDDLNPTEPIGAYDYDGMPVKRPVTEKDPFAEP